MGEEIGIRLSEELWLQLRHVPDQELEGMIKEINTTIETLLTLDYEFRKLHRLKFAVEDSIPKTEERVRVRAMTHPRAR